MTRRRLLAAAAGAGALAAERRNKAPVSHENLVVKLPEAAAVKLSNGVTVLALEDNRLPIATVLIRVEGAGPIYGPPGVAEMTAEMLKEGGAGRSGKQLTEEASKFGATFTSGAAAGAEAASIDGSGLTSRFTEWFSLLGGIVQRPGFPADEFSARRQAAILSNRMRASQASVLVEDTLQRLVYGTHPAAMAVPPSEALAALTTENLASWHRERYVPGNTLIACIGRVKPAALVAQSEKVFGTWKGGEAKTYTPPAPEPSATRRIALVDRPGAVQTELALGGLLFERRDPDYFPMLILNSVLGATSGSRLYQKLHDEKGYAYATGSFFNPARFRGAWRVRAGVNRDSAADSLAIILAELRRLIDVPLSTAELDEAKMGVVGKFAVNLEQPVQVILQSYLRHRYGFSDDYWERYPAKVNGVTATEIQAVAQKYLQPDRAHIVAVGDAAKIRPALAKLGPIE